MKDLTQGSVLSHALTMAVPIFAGLVLVLLCGLIDLYFVAGLGEAAVAGVGAAGNAGFLVSALTQIVSVGTLAAISQAVGRKDRADANFIFNQSLGLSAVCGICTLAVGFAVARPYMNSVAADAATVEAGTTYLVWFMPALALQFAMLAMASALRGIGIVTPTMVVQALTVIINVILAPVLIVGWGTGYALGVKGAGLASSLAVAIGVVSPLGVFPASRELSHPRSPAMASANRTVEAHPERGASRRRRVRHHVRLHGGDILCHRGIWSGRASRLQHRLACAGTYSGTRDGDCFHGGADYRTEFRREKWRAGKSGGRKCLDCRHGGDGIATAVTQWQPELLLQGFTQDEATISEGALFLKMVSLNLVAQGLIFACSSAFQGLGNTRPQLISSTVRLITYVIPTLWLSARSGFRVEQIWYLSIATTTMQALLSLWLLNRELGKRLVFSQVR